MKRISQATKEALVKKALSQPGVYLKEFAANHNISYSGIMKWLREYRNPDLNQRTNSSGKKMARLERVQHILATAALDDNALGVYCRERGLYTAQLQEWKKELMTENNDQKNQSLQDELKALRIENAQLKKEVRRKDQALAETAALLVLKKKANAIWGDPEDV
jgi:transposase